MTEKWGVCICESLRDFQSPVFTRTKTGSVLKNHETEESIPTETSQVLTENAQRHFQRLLAWLL